MEHIQRFYHVSDILPRIEPLHFDVHLKIYPTKNCQYTFTTPTHKAYSHSIMFPVLPLKMYLRSYIPYLCDPILPRLEDFVGRAAMREDGDAVCGYERVRG